jgi:hypothetical protein
LLEEIRLVLRTFHSKGVTALECDVDISKRMEIVVVWGWAVCDDDSVDQAALGEAALDPDSFEDIRARGDVSAVDRATGTILDQNCSLELSARVRANGEVM